MLKNTLKIMILPRDFDVPLDINELKVIAKSLAEDMLKQVFNVNSLIKWQKI